MSEPTRVEPDASDPGGLPSPHSAAKRSYEGAMAVQPAKMLASDEDFRAIPLFAGLSHEGLAQLTRTVAKQWAPSGEVLFREGEHGDRMYVILSGVVTVRKVVEGHETELGRLEGGAYFGEMALIGDAPRTATVIAAEEVEFLAIDRETLLSVIASCPAWRSRCSRDTTPAWPRRPNGWPACRRAQAVEQAIAHGPHPLAALVRKMRVERDWGRKVLQALDVVEVVVKYTTMLLLSDYLRRSGGRSPGLEQMVTAAFRRPTLGVLLETSGRLLREYDGREDELFMPELYRLYYRAEGGRAPAAQAFHALNTYRNRLKHGAESTREELVFRRDFEGPAAASEEAPTDSAACRQTGHGIKHQIATILRETAFLHGYPLIYPVSMTYEHGVFEYAYERCTGAYADFDHGVLTYAEPLDNRQLYLLADDRRILRLDPLLRRRRCPTCAHAAIFTLFSFLPTRERAVPADPATDEPAATELTIVRREKLEYLSYTCGHTLVDQVSTERIERGEGLSSLLRG